MKVMVRKTRGGDDDSGVEAGKETNDSSVLWDMQVALDCIPKVLGSYEKVLRKWRDYI